MGIPALSARWHNCNIVKFDHIPLYPQYASASTGSCLKNVIVAGARLSNSTIHLIHAFYQHPAFIQAQAAIIQPYLHPGAFLLFSYHGLPEQQPCQRAAQPFAGAHVRQSLRFTVLSRAVFCNHGKQRPLYRLRGTYDTVFQSRMGLAPWTQPYLPVALKSLLKRCEASYHCLPVFCHRLFRNVRRNW